MPTYTETLTHVNEANTMRGLASQKRQDVGALYNALHYQTFVDLWTLWRNVNLDYNSQDYADCTALLNDLNTLAVAYYAKFNENMEQIATGDVVLGGANTLMAAGFQNYLDGGDPNYTEQKFTESILYSDQAKSQYQIAFWAAEEAEVKVNEISYKMSEILNRFPNGPTYP